MMVVELKGRRRLTSVNRASEPYEAKEGTVSVNMQCIWLGSIDNVPRLSAAMTTPSLNLTASTEVPVTTGDCVCCFGPVI